MPNYWVNNNSQSNAIQQPQQNQPCPQLPGTILRVYLPAGATVNLANLLEVSSPSGVCLIVRIPALGGGFNLNSLIQSIQQAGGTVEFSN